MSTWEGRSDPTVALAETADELVQRHLVVVVRIHLLEHLLHINTLRQHHLQVLLVRFCCGRDRLRNAIGHGENETSLVHVIDNILSRLHHQLKLVQGDVSLSLRVDHAERKGLDITDSEQTNELLLRRSSRQNVQTSDVVLKRDLVVPIGAERVEQQICEDRFCCLAQQSQRLSELKSTLLSTIHDKRVQTLLVLRVGLEVVQVVLQILLCESRFRLHVRIRAKLPTDSADRFISLGILGCFEYSQCKCSQSIDRSMISEIERIPGFIPKYVRIRHSKFDHSGKPRYFASVVPFQKRPVSICS